MSFLILLLACVEDAALPNLGDCAAYPDGVYEYGQVGIGTCLAGPSDLAFLPDGHTLAVSNANPWLNFTGGSLLTLDMDAVDLDAGRNVISELSSPAAAFELPTFSGAMDLDAARETLLVTNRLSEDGRTRETNDRVYFIDVSDPSSPEAAPIGPDGEGSMEVGYDPNAVLYDAPTDRAFVVDRTSHLVSVLNMGVTPVELVSRDGDASVTGDDFVDVDGSGSRAEFVTLETEDAISITPHHWSLSWGEGTVRLWQPNAQGAYRLTNSGAGWLRSPIPAEVSLDNTGGVHSTLNDPDVYPYTNSDGYRRLRMLFEDGGAFWFADARYYLSGSGETWQGEWAFGEDDCLEGAAGAWDETIQSPNVVESGGYQWLFYDGTGADGAQSIGIAVASDGATFERYQDTPVLSIDGAAVADPFVYGDEETGLWRMFFTRTDADGSVSLGQAQSVDLLTWEVLAWEMAGQAPAAGAINGELRLYFNRLQRDGWKVMEARSRDGIVFDEPVVVAAVEDAADATSAPGLALQVEADQHFSLEDESGSIYDVAIAPGDTVTDADRGFSLRVAAGFVSSPSDLDDDTLVSVRVDSRVGDTVWGAARNEDDVGVIITGAWDGDTITWDTSAPFDGGGVFDADGVSSPVVYEDGAGFVMYYAGEADGVTTIGRASSTDGVSWTAEADPILTASDTWESVSMVPGSVEVLDDGTLRLWYTGFDGADWRIGYAESTDGLSFTRVPGDLYPWIFDSGIPGDWDDSGVRDPCVIRDGDIDRMWFAGYDGNNWQIGYAEQDVDGDWTESTDQEGSARPVLAAGSGSFGTGAVLRPIVVADLETGGWDLLYTGEDANIGRIGHAVAYEADRVHRDLRLPTVADTWGFSSIPKDETGAIDLDSWADDQDYTARGCTALAADEARGFVYVACKLVPLVFVLDVRDDSTDADTDLNYLGVEEVLFVQTSTDTDSGLRDVLYDPVRDVLWGLQDDPEAVYQIRVDDVVDDDDTRFIRDRVLGMLPLPRGDERDQGAATMASVGPGAMALHPDGQHLFVTNFNANSVTAFDLGLGPLGTEVGEAIDVGENPYAIALSPDGTIGVVGNYAGEVMGDTTNSTLAVLDTDPTSATFMQVRTWVVNK